MQLAIDPRATGPEGAIQMNRLDQPSGMPVDRSQCRNYKWALAVRRRESLRQLAVPHGKSEGPCGESLLQFFHLEREFWETRQVVELPGIIAVIVEFILWWIRHPQVEPPTV